MPLRFLSHSQMPARMAPARTLAKHSANASAVSFHHQLLRTCSGVNLGVTVVDREGNYVTDLDADDFVIIDDGKPQPITYFARGEEGVSAPEMHVGLLFDTSGSMTDDIALARSAAVRFLNTLRDARDKTLFRAPAKTIDDDTGTRPATAAYLFNCPANTDAACQGRVPISAGTEASTAVMKDGWRYRTYEVVVPLRNSIFAATLPGTP